MRRWAGDYGEAGASEPHRLLFRAMSSGDPNQLDAAMSLVGSTIDINAAMPVDSPGDSQAISPGFSPLHYATLQVSVAVCLARRGCIRGSGHGRYG